MDEFIIELKQLHFFSFHGLFAEERKVGGEFIVDLSVKYVSNQKVITSLDETINYAALYDIVKKEMNEPRDLMETITQSIADKIQQQFPVAKEIKITIAKKNPPITGISGNVAVTYFRQTGSL